MQKKIRIAAQLIDEEDIRSVEKALRAEVVTRGPLVEEFEQKIADYVGAKGAVAFNSATSALSASYDAIELSPFDRVLTTPNTFVGSVTGAYLKGASVEYADIDAHTGNIDIEHLTALMNRPRTRGKEVVLAVHFAGQAIEMARLEAQIKNPSTIVIEDAAHALGSFDIQGNRIGACTYSDMTIFSFHPQKTMTTMEGGVVTSNDETLLERLRTFRNNGIVRSNREDGFYEVQAFTGNYNFTEAQAALGLSQLKKLDSWIMQRERLRAHYLKELESLSFVQPLTAGKGKTAWHLFVVRIDFEALGKTREAVMQELSACGIETRVHYIPLYMHPAVQQKQRLDEESFPQMQRYYVQALSLPFHCAMTLEDATFVVMQLSAILKGRRGEY